MATTTLPAAKVSFGPNGTHWPRGAQAAPYKGDKAAYEIVVDCSWTAIAAALKTVTAAMALAGVVIRVKRGTLPGYGAASGSTAVLSGVGSADWARNVLIWPQEGWGTVLLGGGARLDSVARISLFGLKGTEQGMVITNSRFVDVGWSWFGAGPNINTAGSDVNLYEVITGGKKSNADVGAIRPSGATTVVRVGHYGCLYMPNVKPDGDAAHLDTYQTERTGTGGRFGDFVYEDGMYYGSSNGVFITSAADGLTFRHSFVIGSDLPWRVFPLSAGDYVGRPNAINGGATNVRLYDSIVAGSIGSVKYIDVQRTQLSYQPQASQQPTANGGSGAWTVNTAIADYSGDYLKSLCPLPTDAYLDALWNKDGVGVPTDPTDPGDGGTTDPGTGTPTDTTGPALTLVYPVDGQTVSGNVTFRIKAVDGESTVESVIWKSGSVTIGSATKGSNDEWLLPVNSSAFPPGSYTVTATAKSAGGTTSKSAAVTLAADGGGTTPPAAQPPQGAILRLASSTVLPYNGPLDVDISATDDGYIKTVELWSELTDGGTADKKVGSALATSTAGVYRYRIVDVATELPVDQAFNLYAKIVDSTDLLTETARVTNLTKAKPVDDTLPLEFDMLSAVGTGVGTIRVAWRPSGDAVNPQLHLEGYQLFMDDGRAVGTKIDGTVLVVAGLDEYSEHDFYVEATDKRGNVRRSRDVVTGRTWANPVSAPTPATVTTTGISKVRVRWTAVTHPKGPVKYRIFLNKGATPVLNDLEMLTTEVTVPAGAPGTIRVEAYLEPERPTATAELPFTTATAQQSTSTTLIIDGPARDTLGVATGTQTWQWSERVPGAGVSPQLARVVKGEIYREGTDEKLVMVVPPAGSDAFLIVKEEYLTGGKVVFDQTRKIRLVETRNADGSGTGRASFENVVTLEDSYSSGSVSLSEVAEFMKARLAEVNARVALAEGAEARIAASEIRIKATEQRILEAVAGVDPQTPVTYGMAIDSDGEPYVTTAAAATRWYNFDTDGEPYLTATKTDYVVRLDTDGEYYITLQQNGS